MTAYELRSYPGAAADTKLNADLASNGLTFSVTPGTGSNYPDGSGGPFFVILDYDNSKAEKIRVASRINDTFTVNAVGDRGVDGTSAQAHSANATVRAVWTATDAQEANRAAHYTIGLVTTKGDLLAGTGSGALGRVPAGADGTPLVADSTQTTGLRYDNTAWTTYTPTFGNITGGAGNFAYKLRGKTLYIRGYFTAGTYTGAGAVTVSLPGVTSAAGVNQLIPGNGVGNWFVSASTVMTTVGTNPGGTSVVGAYFTGVIEVQ